MIAQNCKCLESSERFVQNVKVKESRIGDSIQLLQRKGESSTYLMTERARHKRKPPFQQFSVNKGCSSLLNNGTRGLLTVYAHLVLLSTILLCSTHFPFHFGGWIINCVSLDYYLYLLLKEFFYFIYISWNIVEKSSNIFIVEKSKKYIYSWEKLEIYS